MTTERLNPEQFGFPIEPQRSLDEVEAYDAMFEFLDAFWRRGGKSSDDLASLLGSMSREIWDDGGPADPAFWTDWLDAIERVQANKSSIG